MKRSEKQLGRPPVNRDRALSVLRRSIISGKWPAGGMVPSRRELQKTLRVDTRTLEETMRQLRADGFIQSRPRGGTFIAANPPHLCHYALTFPFSMEAVPSQFYRALREEAIKLQAPEERFSLFYDILERRDLPDYQRLVGMIQRHALAGVIYAARPAGLWNDPVLTEPHMPRVVIAAGPREAGIPAVAPDGTAFLPRAFEWLAERNRRRVAILSLAHNVTPALIENQVRAVAGKFGLVTNTRWIQAAAADTAAWASNQVAGLVYGPPSDRPDALVITDDNLVPAGTAGVLLTDRRVGVDLDVVAHANFPHVTPSAVPARRLGFDVRQLLGVAMERLHQLRHGETPPMSTFVPVVWEEEVAAAQPPVFGMQKSEVRSQTGKRKREMAVS